MAHPSLRDARDQFGRETVTLACRAALDDLRHRITDSALDGEELAAACRDLPERVAHILNENARDAYPEIVNATGVLIHTNLGRAPISAQVPGSLASYLALEYDVATGRRGQRLAPLRDRIARVCGAEWAVMVNNNAAALLLIFAALARDREVIVSRSQLIEIGGSFRLPEVIESSGARLVEVGCTNRTHLRDYESALGDDSGAILVAHQSNFRIVGFTASPPASELADLAHTHDLPLVIDQGTGALHDLKRWGFDHEPTVSELLADGADLVCFSGDKLLGGPQAGLVVGSRQWVEPLGKHPLYRALRPDKTALALMDRVLQAHRSGHLEHIPLYAMLDTPVERLRRRARSIGRRLRSAGVEARGRATLGALGGGTTPAETIPSYGLAVRGGQRLHEELRAADPPVVGRLDHDDVILDLRTVFPHQDATLVEVVVSAWTKLVQG